ncbi:YihY/virulence factor BrkB family protein [Microbacterium sp. CFBP9034]|uniref:YihY/virulence factor BrkB family protein n=1 Tax=Microbacterium sp. CFBP9034 TaxID=3096540 RepID=UPI002A6B3A88|nr:YihY/virulence factor BrkB family protein [Microbacterium sp. CFBP9034]MDY0908935.1 YihY/virulence factor BrkB family protein [Microbacterium sp. CFBP9034]
MTHTPPPDARAAADAAQREEESLRERWEATETSLRQRFDAPISRATHITQVTMAWFPVRVWRHFLIENGFLLGAGVSYVALFASFAAIYVAFAIAGLWLGGSEDAVNGLIELINSYIPGLIADDSAFATPDMVQEIASQNAEVLGWTGIIALGALIWTAIDWVTYSRRAVRVLFAIPPDRRSYVFLKARDFLAALIFGAALIVGFALSSIGTLALDWLFSLLRWPSATGLVNIGVRTGSAFIGFAITSAALAGLFRFLTGTKLPWRRIWPGAMLGGLGISVLQLGAGLLLSYTPSNPLLATFAVFIGMLLWFRLIGIVMLVAAAWIAVAAKDRDVVLLAPTEAERLAAEHSALLIAAQVRLRTAKEAREQAPWYRTWAADRALREAQDELREVEAATPAPVARVSPLAPVVKPGKPTKRAPAAAGTATTNHGRDLT